MIAAGRQLHVRHAPADKRVALARTVEDIEPGHAPGCHPTWFRHGDEFADNAIQRRDVAFGPIERHGSERIAHQALGDRMPFGMIGVEQGVRRTAGDNLTQLPPQIDRVLDAEAHAEAARRVVDVRRIAGEQHAALAVGFRLPGHVGETGDVGRIADAEVVAIVDEKRLAQQVKRRLAAARCALRHQDSGLPVRGPVQGMDADAVFAQAPFRCAAVLGFGQEMADGRIGPRKGDAGSLAHRTAAAVATDEVLRAKHAAVGELHVEAAGRFVELREFGAAQDGDAELFHPIGQDALAGPLGNGETIGVSRRKSADVQTHAGKGHDLHRGSLGEEAPGNAALVENLDGAGMQAQRTRLDAHPVRPPLDNDSVDAGQPQFGAEHQPGRAGAHDDYPMPAHRISPWRDPNVVKRVLVQTEPGRKPQSSRWMR